MTTVTRRVACFCESSFDTSIPSSADLVADPGMEELILGGEFMAVNCPACGKRLTPEFPFRLSGVREAKEIFMIPEADRVAYLRGSLDYPIGTPGRIVIGFPELAEKVLVFGRALDDRVIEIMKYYLLTAGAGEADPNADREMTLRYRGMEGGKHLFHIIGMKEGEVGVARLAAEIYSRIAGDVETRVLEEPFRDFCEPPWVSLRRVAGGGQ